MTPSIGAAVFFEGLQHRIAEIFGDHVRFVSELLHVGADGTSRPRFETVARLSDLRWSDDLAAWYLWGRVLGKGRGGVGMNCREIVAELRDRGILPARTTRRPGQAPAGGEHENLECSLFRAGVDWPRELARLRRSEELSDGAKAAVAAYAERFEKKLIRGYADPGANDSWGTEG